MRKSSRHTVRAGVSMLAAITLAACGGGGGGGGSSLDGRSGISSGVITGKGSVIVNGVEFETPENPEKIIIDDTPGHDESELKIGMFVKIKAVFDSSSRGRATEIEAEAEVKGVATVTGGSLRVLEQTVNVNGATRFEATSATAGDLSPLDGAFVEVHGLFTGPSTILATLVEREDPGEDEAELRGTVTGLIRDGDTGILFIGMQEVRFDRFGTRFEDVTVESLREGDFVEIEGLVVGSTLVAEKIEKEDFRDDREGADRFEVEGVADDVTPGLMAFTLLGPGGLLAVRWDGDTAFEDGTEADLADGVMVEVKGSLQADGVLLAREIEFENEFENTVRIEVGLDTVDPDNRTVTVLGLLVNVAGARLDDVATLAALAAVPNAHVEIRGNPDGLGGVNASRLKLEDPDGRTILQGPVDSHDPGGPDLVILGITVRTNANTEFENAADNPIGGGTFFGSITDGITIVKARGSFDAGTNTLTAEEIELEIE